MFFFKKSKKPALDKRALADRILQAADTLRTQKKRLLAEAQGDREIDRMKQDAAEWAGKALQNLQDAARLLDATILSEDARKNERLKAAADGLLTALEAHIPSCVLHFRELEEQIYPLTAELQGEIKAYGRIGM